MAFDAQSGIGVTAPDGAVTPTESRLTLNSLVLSSGWRLLPLAFLVLVVSLSGAYPIRLIKTVVNVALEPGASDRQAIILRLGAVYVGLNVVWSLARYGLDLLSRTLQAEQAHRLRSRVWRHALRLRPLPLNDLAANDIVVDVLKDAEIATTDVMRPILYIVESVATFLIGLVLMLSISWRMTLFVFPLGLFAAVLSRRSGGRMRSLAGEVRDRTTAMWGLFGEVMRGLKDVQTNDAVACMDAKLSALSYRTCDATIENAKYNGRTEALNTVFFMMTIGCIMTFGAVLVARGALSIGGLTAFMMYNGMLVDPVMHFFGFYRDLQTMHVSIGRLERLFAYPTFAIVGAPVGPVHDGTACPTIDLQGVSLSFGARLAALRSIDLHIDAGSRVAVVGPSGCGKTTLLHVMAGLYTPDAGTVSVGGIKLTDDAWAYVRANVTIVFQDPYLFNTTLEENVRLGAVDAECGRVAHAIHLARLADFCATSEEGLQAVVGEAGSKLSGGERQRAALARAFVRRTPIILLDESTSALDSATSKILLAEMIADLRGSTLVLVAHKISSITGFPRILVMDDGEVVADGTHAKLMETCALYRDLYTQQFAEERASGGHAPMA